MDTATFRQARQLVPFAIPALAGIGLGRARVSAFMVSAAAAGAAGAVMAFAVRLAAPSGDVEAA